METTAKLRFLHMSPKKVRLVSNMVRGLPVLTAENQLRHVHKFAHQPVLKLLQSAVANAEHNFDMKEDNLYIKEIKVDGGGMFKRWSPRAHGRATMIQKKMSHITLTLAEITPTPEKEAKKKDQDEKPIRLKSKDEIKEAPIQERVAMPESAIQESPEEKGTDIHDPRMEGKHRHQQHQDARSGKGKGGVKRKLFNRKSG